MKRASHGLRPYSGEEFMESRGRGIPDGHRADLIKTLRPVQNQVPLVIARAVQSRAPQHGPVGVGQCQDPSLEADAETVKEHRVVVGVRRVDLVLHPQGDGNASDYSVYGGERRLGQGQGSHALRGARGVREPPWAQGACASRDEIEQGVEDLDAAGGVDEQRLLPLPDRVGGREERANGVDLRVQGVHAVAHVASAREPQRTRDLIGQQRALLEDVDSAIEESQCDLRAFAGACRRGDDDARDIDVVGQVVDARVTGDAVLRGDSA